MLHHLKATILFVVLGAFFAGPGYAQDKAGGPARNGRLIPCKSRPRPRRCRHFHRRAICSRSSGTG